MHLKLIDLDLPIGNTWSTKFASNEYTDVTYTFKVIGTGSNRTVNGTNYTDVICVQLTTTWEISASLIALYSQYMTAEQIQVMKDQTSASNFVQKTYYAKNVGSIEQTSETAGLNVQLLSSTIK